MSRKWLLFPFCLSVLLTLVPRSSASLTLRVNESATRVLFEERATRILLSVENSLGRRVNAHIKLELIDTDGAIRATAERSNRASTPSQFRSVYGYPVRQQPIRAKCSGTVCAIKSRPQVQRNSIRRAALSRCQRSLRTYSRFT